MSEGRTQKAQPVPRMYKKMAATCPPGQTVPHTHVHGIGPADLRMEVLLAMMTVRNP